MQRSDSSDFNAPWLLTQTTMSDTIHSYESISRILTSQTILCVCYMPLCPTAMSSCELGLQFGCRLRRSRREREVVEEEEEEATLLSLFFLLVACRPVSQLSIIARASSQQEPRMYGALIKSASRQWGKTPTEPKATSELQLKCCSAAERENLRPPEGQWETQLPACHILSARETKQLWLTFALATQRP